MLRCNRGQRNKPGLLLPSCASHPFSNFVDSRVVAVSTIISTCSTWWWKKAVSIVVTKNRAQRGHATHPVVINHALNPYQSLILLTNAMSLFFQLSNSRFRLDISSVNFLYRWNYEYIEFGLVLCFSFIGKYVWCFLQRSFPFVNLDVDTDKRYSLTLKKFQKTVYDVSSFEASAQSRNPSVFIKRSLPNEIIGQFSFFSG